MYLIFHLSLCYLLPTVQPLCPDGFAEVYFGCYKHVPSAKPVSFANTYCASLDDKAKIIDLETETEFTAVLNWMLSGKLFLLIPRSQ